jgi:hypothetical protein
MEVIFLNCGLTGITSVCERLSVCVFVFEEKGKCEGVLAIYACVYISVLMTLIMFKLINFQVSVPPLLTLRNKYEKNVERVFIPVRGHGEL